MAQRRIAGFALLLAAVFLAGCEETAKKQVQVHPPAPAPAPAPNFAENLPFPPFHPSAVYLHTEPKPYVDALIDKAEASAEAGDKDYQAGNLDAAREDFDRAIDLILNSGLDVKSEPRLSQLFDGILDKVHNYELEAAQNQEENPEEGMGEPAPIEEIANLSLPAGDPRLALKAEQELIAVPHDLPLTVNDSVLSYLSFFQTPRGSAIVERGLSRSGRYREMILRVLKQEGLPQDLIYLAQAESAFQPQAVSRAGARGIWQFMPYRGREYELERTWWVDERSDPEKATHAAAQHLRDLYQMFGDWYLVMAAYNSGPLNVVRAIERTGYADFWELQKRNALPKQTKNYVPIIIALALVAKDPAGYGIQVDLEKPPEVERVKPGHPIDLRLVADAIDADLDDLHLMNPELLRFVTPNDPNFEINLPAGSADRFRAAIAQIPPEKWTSWRLYKVQEGDMLSTLARHYRVTVSSIQQLNHLEPHEPLTADSKLIIPTTPAPVRLVHYRVRRGDSLEGIAERFSVTVPDLKRWNGIRGTRAPRGTRLRIYAGGSTPGFKSFRSKSNRKENVSAAQVENAAQSSPTSGTPVSHRVRAGETLYSIAREYRTTVAALRQTNPFLQGRGLEAGDLLTISPVR